MGDELLRVEDLGSPGRFEGVSFTLRAGEIVGLAGLVGSGRSELAQALFGLDARAPGRVWLGGAPLALGDPRAALARGLGFVPEDRKKQGLVLGLSVLENTTLPILERLAQLTFVDRKAERTLAHEHGRAPSREGTRASTPSVAGLSGGNQQKVVLAKWLAARCRVLILDEPTRGVDVGAKAEIHALIDQLAAEGNAVLLISSELPEIIRLSTRVLVLREGRLAGELPRPSSRRRRCCASWPGCPRPPPSPWSERGPLDAIRPASWFLPSASGLSSTRGPPATPCSPSTATSGPGGCPSSP